MLLSQLETPALIIDLDIFEYNINKMKEMINGKLIKLRPHYKSHKCSVIAHKQMKAGAKGITCAKLSEAEDLAYSGIKDILIANQIVDPVKILRLAQIARVCRITICVDNEENIIQLSQGAKYVGSQIYCLVELNSGMERCGVNSFEEVYKLAKLINNSENLVFEGIQSYAGHISHEENMEKCKTTIVQLEKKLMNLKFFLENKGIKVKENSGGSTGTSLIKSNSNIYTELQAGSYILMDATYKKTCPEFKNALFILSTVISSRKDVFITDTGIKSCSVDQDLPQLLQFPDAAIYLNEEHSIINFKGHNFKIKDKILYIPGHCCTTVNLFDKIYFVRKGQVEDVSSITSRGRSI